MIQETTECEKWPFPAVLRHVTVATWRMTTFGACSPVSLLHARPTLQVSGRLDSVERCNLVLRPQWMFLKLRTSTMSSPLQ